MNKVELIGRFVKDPEVIRKDDTVIAKGRIAVTRKYKKEGGDEADFISVVAFGKTAEFIERFFFKGKLIGITGRIQSGRYQNKDGQTVYTTDVVIEDAEFVGSKGDDPGNDRDEAPKKTDDFMSLPEGIEDEIPFGN